MREDGFTLLEVLTVMAIIGILLGIATLQFNEMSKKAAIEGQVQTLHADLMAARLKALYGKRDRTVRIIGRQFSLYSSTVTSVIPEQQKTMTFPVFANTSTDITFDSNGLTTNLLSLCIDPLNDLSKSNPASVDSLVVSQARINIGKRRAGGACGTATIDQQ